jgi:hypothetical protein
VPKSPAELSSPEPQSSSQLANMRVAIAGYGDLTHYICEEFGQFGHELIILTRSHKPQLEKQGFEQAVTDYTLPSLRGCLADYDVLISTISDISPAYTDIHRNLIAACQESPTCRRFVPAEFAADIEACPDQPAFYFGPHEPVREILRNQEVLEWTLVCIGWLADYFVPPGNRHIKDIGRFHPVDLKERSVLIPGTGNEPIDFTWARDVVRGLAALVESPPGSWEPYTFMSGERSCWNSAVELLLRKSLLPPDTEVRHTSLREIVETRAAVQGGETQLLAEYQLLSISQACATPPGKVQGQRERLFPNVVFRSLQEGILQHCKYPDSII